ncbi:MAG: twin-arginine translocase TatA/TatE family subunit [Chloroflexi bacterium]|jgi:sec-independent protein translocase protein TatA|nr:twin-arginine translocase TatA/TatE family subunit [Chloroflexota bacterium]|tara:strand:- start:1800 stop:1988 length:189 start_codon:yes stop_codon:yes gene_type:complete
MPFGLGPTELIIILGIALLLFGAKRLPEIGSSLGNAIKEFRKTQSDDSNSEKKSISSSDKKE